MNAEGAAIFVGPQQAKVVTSLKKALNASDSIIVVSGDIGVGKTTIVTRALETNSAYQVVAWIGRMKLPPDDVLQLLLAGFGIRRQFSGTIQRFAAFRTLLNEWAAADKRVVIVVEDATRIGNDALLELESLTAADSGAGSGANIVLMGPPEITKVIAAPDLARLRQRSRLAQAIVPFNAVEAGGYMKHCVRAAGGDYATIFETDAADMVYRCSAGVPRVINILCLSALQAAAEGKLEKVTAGLVRKVAAEVHALEPVLPAAAATPEVPKAAVAKPVETDLPPKRAAAGSPEPLEQPEPPEQLEPPQPPEPPEPPEPIETQFDLPQLKKRIPPLEMTGADFRAPSIDPVADAIPALDAKPAKPGAETKSDPLPETTDEPDTADIPTLSNSMRVEHPLTESLAMPEDPPPPEKETTDPETGAEPESTAARTARTPPAAPIPDLDALEAAISVAHKREEEPKKSAPPADKKPPLLEPEIQEITLDDSLDTQRIGKGPELSQVAEELSKAASLEDISDVGAETLFGEELEAAAAAALGQPAAEGTPGEFMDEPSPVMLEMPDEPPADPDSGEQQAGDFDMSVSQRYAMVNALRNPGAPAASNQAAVKITLGRDEIGVPPKPHGEVGPNSIEDQIDIELTQTQKSLKIVPPAKAGQSRSKAAKTKPPPVKKAAEDKKSSTLMGLFRRSSKN